MKAKWRSVDLGYTTYKFMDVEMNFQSSWTKVTQIKSLWVQKYNFKIDESK